MEEKKREEENVTTAARVLRFNDVDKHNARALSVRITHSLCALFLLITHTAFMDYQNPDSSPRCSRCRMPRHRRKNCNNPVQAIRTIKEENLGNRRKENKRNRRRKEGEKESKKKRRGKVAAVEERGEVFSSRKGKKREEENVAAMARPLRLGLVLFVSLILEELPGTISSIVVFLDVVALVERIRHLFDGCEEATATSSLLSLFLRWKTRDHTPCTNLILDFTQISPCGQHLVHHAGKTRFKSSGTALATSCKNLKIALLHFFVSFKP
ncbi:hypothetical protein M9H77_01400 [Catharanthus roseus]|uniref:Uncharacterized protein n=1 Tax=Catharanthus roseus TaxID=4058 RepID=A0ACC0C5X2_CATRO|nr:hypothetical protein M9H77_01400 [Catharanthus roseus]